MPVEKIGINFSALQNITPPEFDLKNNSAEMAQDIPNKANIVTKGYLGLGILLGLFTYLMFVLHDKSPFGRFRYSNIRATGISAGICASLGIICLIIGFFQNYYHVVVFLTVFVLSILWIIKEE